MKQFNIPELYKSGIIGKIKAARREKDKLKKDFSATRLDFGSFELLLARHFGFCYGVENAVEIAYRALAENKDKRVFLLSEMIHNPDVNADLQAQGVQFIMNTNGNNLIAWENINVNDVVIVPAFGTTVEIQKLLNDRGIDPYGYDTTCPFVEKVWKKANQLGQGDYTVIIHGKASHEETRATFSHSKEGGASLIIENMAEAELLACYIKGQKEPNQFYIDFANRFSVGFDVQKDLKKLGVVNQTTMLAEDTQGIADFLKNTVATQFNLNKENLSNHFADTRDTLCYATNDNQQATNALLQNKADFAIVVGGYNSANTQHLVELCENKLPTYFIKTAGQIDHNGNITSYNFHTKQEHETHEFLGVNTKPTILLTCGASCPDAVMEEVLVKLHSLFANAKSIEEVLLTDLN